MNWKHLLWIIPITFLIGVLFYAYLQMHSDRMLFSAMHSCYCELYNMTNNSNCIQYRLLNWIK